MRAVTRTIALTALLLTPAVSAFAQEPPPGAPPAEPPPSTMPPAASAPAMAPASSGAFCSLGQFVLSVDLPFTNEAPQFAIYHESVSMNGPSSTIIEIEPSLDYFVAPNLSVGGEVGVLHGDGIAGITGATVTAIVIEARVGYNIPINEMFSLWPHLGIGYEHVSASANGNSASGYTIPLVVTVPILWHPASHFFLGLGPTLTTELASKLESMDQPKTTDIGLTGVLGGYFGS
jgi:hypothetical protein